MARKSISTELKNNIELLRAWAMWRIKDENEKEIFLRLLATFTQEGENDTSISPNMDKDPFES